MRDMETPTNQYEQFEKVEKTSLPVDEYEPVVVDALRENDVIIIDAKTGAGKSTRVPRFLYDSGEYRKVFVTQPRIIAARNVSNRIAEELTIDGFDGGSTAGYQTAHEGNATEEHSIIICTDGLMLMKMLDEGSLQENDVVVIDEYHERKNNMDIVLALCHKFKLKTVIMSATLNTHDLAAHCNEARGTSFTPIIEIPGRNYEVEELKGQFVHEEVVAAADRGENVLTFVPGRKEARSVMAHIRNKVSCRVLMLNGDQTPEEQQQALESYEEGKIVISTSVGQTSITIPDIDTVVDCGWERTGEYNRKTNARGIPIRPCSKATSEQRRGRVGRTKPGKYIRAKLANYPDIPTNHLEQNPFDKPEILRTDLANIVVRLGTSAIKMSDLNLFEGPGDRKMENVYARLRNLGAVAAKGYELTETGRDMAYVSLDVGLARMTVEAKKYGEKIHKYMMMGAAAVQVNDITSTEKHKMAWKRLSQDNASDIIQQMDVMYEAMKMTAEERRRYGIVEQRYNKAKQYLDVMLMHEQYDLTFGELNSQDRENLRVCVLKGSETVFTRSGVKYFGDDHNARTISASSKMRSSLPNIILGEKFDLYRMSAEGLQEKQIVTHPISATYKELQYACPERITEKFIGYKEQNGKRCGEFSIYFDKTPLGKTVTREAVPSRETMLYALGQLFSYTTQYKGKSHHVQSIRKQVHDMYSLQHRTSEDLMLQDFFDDLSHDIADRIPSEKVVFSVEEAAEYCRINDLEQYIDDKTRRFIMQNSPSHVRAGSYTYDVTYKNNVARLTVERKHLLSVIPYLSQLKGRQVKVRHSKHEQYHTIEQAMQLLTQPSRDVRRDNKPKTYQVNRDKNPVKQIDHQRFDNTPPRRTNY